MPPVVLAQVRHAGKEQCYFGFSYVILLNIICNLKVDIVKAVLVCFEYFKKKRLSINFDKCHFIHKNENWHVRDIIEVDGKLLMSEESCDLLGGKIPATVANVMTLMGQKTV